MNIYSLSDNFGLSGEWYLPDNVGRSMAGELLYDREHTELRLHDTFRPFAGEITAGDDIVEYPVVHGMTTEGFPVTILNAIRSKISVAFGPTGIRQADRLVTSSLLIGAHVDVETTYPEMHFRIPGLHVWLSRATVRQKLSEENVAPGESFHSFQIFHLPGETVRVEILGATIVFATRNLTSADEFSIALKSEAWLEIRPDVPQSLGWYLEQHGRLEPLLAFLAGTPMSTDRIVAKQNGSNGTIAVQVSMRDVHYCTFKGLHEFFITRGSMGLDLYSLFNNWFELSKRIHIPSQLALSVLASERLWLHVEFLSLIQALEGFHRGIYPGIYIPDDEYEEVKKSIGDAIPSVIGADHRAALKSRIRYGNQISLAKRLNELVSELPLSIRKLVLGADGKIARSWIDTRNYHTHWDEELRAGIIEGQEMYEANVRLRCLLRVLYLHHIGVSEIVLGTALVNTSAVSQLLMELNARESRRRNPPAETTLPVTIEVDRKIDGAQARMTLPATPTQDSPVSGSDATDETDTAPELRVNDNTTLEERSNGKVARKPIEAFAATLGVFLVGAILIGSFLKMWRQEFSLGSFGAALVVEVLCGVLLGVPAGFHQAVVASKPNGKVWYDYF